MTIEALRKKSTGVLESRSFTIKHNGHEYEEYYSLVKGNDGKYFIGFSDDGSYCSNTVCEEDMIHLINDTNYSDREAIDIYMQSPHLSCWIDD